MSNDIKQKSSVNNKFLEHLRSIPDGVNKSIKKNLVSSNARTAWNQFWNAESSSGFENPSPPEKIERKEIQQKPAYEQTQEFVLFRRDDRETAQKIEEIRQELNLLVKTIKEVDFEVEKAVMQIPVNPGVYHVRFLERIKILLKMIREKLEDSRTWLKVSKSKKSQRRYWNMYKKRGTSFGLSNERVVSTQTG